MVFKELYHRYKNVNLSLFSEDLYGFHSLREYSPNHIGLSKPSRKNGRRRNKRNKII